jgi:hypothetical protein
MRTNKQDNDEREEAWQAALKRFDEAARKSIRRRPRMMAIQVGELMGKAIELNPASLKMIAVDPETGIVVVERPYAATGGNAVLLEAGKNLDVYAVVRR